MNRPGLPRAEVVSGVVQGWFVPGFEPAVEAFERNFLERGEVGAAFAVHAQGQPVLDLWGGLADRAAAVPWSAATLVGIFSGSKGLVATCLAILLDRGQLDLEAPLCEYWPEFAAHGKDGILVRHVVSHQAGMPGLLTPTSVEEATDDVRMAELLAAQQPIAPPGAGIEYHALTFGWLCGELVRRVDGRSIGRFFAEEVAAPLGLDAWIGLPASEEPRVAVLERSSGFSAEQADAPLDPAAEERAWSIWSNPPRFTPEGLAANLPAWHAAEIPATNGIATARSLSRLYGCLAAGGGIDGVRILSSDALGVARTPLAYGADRDTGFKISFGVGYELQTDEPRLGPVKDAFGHPGAGGSVHGAWPSREIGFSYTPNLLDSLNDVDPRAEALLTALREA
ncbi:MAG TPA: serine hydrolase domain-containing protein [Solirubrobacterales bacterium]|nr:serine hydrolase domain-containing protein [Solirubrobacterales bacterium]